MAVTTYDFSNGDTIERPSFWRRIFDALVEARTLEAQRYVNGYLLSLDDNTLETLGHNREDLLSDKVRSYRF